jgi:co-chaperonin GroES (HSP10)
MIDLILPPGVSMPKPIQPAPTQDENIPAEQKATQLPIPQGYKILCIVPDVSENIDGTTLDLVKPTSQLRAEEHGTTVLFVLAVGPDAYKDANKFPSGPWCKQGDFILVRTYSGTRFKMYGKEMRLLNDDQVDAVVVDPRGVTRA